MGDFATPIRLRSSLQAGRGARVMAGNHAPVRAPIPGAPNLAAHADTAGVFFSRFQTDNVAERLQRVYSVLAAQASVQGQ